jgi:tetratricopeptide (TPR) repeat protein
MLRATLRGRLAVLTALSCAFGATATLAVAEPSVADKQRAAELAAQSAEHYKRGELEVAVALLRQAYALYPQPNLLYNLGRSLEKLGDAKAAVDAYQQYLADAKDVPDRPAIERRIAALQATLPPEPAAPPAPPPSIPTPAPAPAPVIATPSAVVATAPARTGAWPWLTIGVGVVLGGTGGVLGYLSSTRHDDAVASTVGASAASLQAEAQHLALAANVLFVVGGVVAASGIVWVVHDHHRAPRAELRVSPVAVTINW